MTFICVPIMVDRTDGVTAALERAGEARVRGAQMVEWRVDQIVAEPGGPGGMEAIGRLCGESPLPCVLTCRSEEEGGFYEGDERGLVEVIELVSGMDHPPRYLDIDWRKISQSAAIREAIRELKEKQAGRDLTTAIIFSIHDFRGRPPTLLKQMAAMAAEPLCDVIKVAWLARSIRDNLEAFELLRQRTKPMIALCMGEYGLMSRVLAPKFGGLLTFASAEEGSGTAPGQPSMDELKHLYRFDSLGPETKVYGVIGWPVGHSLSPRTHNAGFTTVGHDGVYLPLPVPPEWEHFKATGGELIDSPILNFRGASVTIPHKEHLVRFIEERGGRLDELSAKIGAANTLVVGATGAVGGWNTDGPAAVEVLTAGLGISREELGGEKVAILGAGGVARSIAGELVDCGCEITIFNRTDERAYKLAQELGASVGNPRKLVAGGSGSTGGFDVYVNCTSIGMEGSSHPHESPLEALAGRAVLLDPDAIYFDAVYAPEKTVFLRQAQQAGARTIPGAGLFRRQAAKQFELWTGGLLPDL